MDPALYGRRSHGNLVLNADGSYVYTVTGPVAGPVDDVFTYTIKDADGDLAFTTLTIQVNEDIPVAVLDEVSVDENVPKSFDLLFILDVSGSMRDSSGINGDTRLEAAGEALKLLVDAYFSISSDVSIDIVSFASGATDEGNFTTAARAFREQLFELVRTARTPEELLREFEPPAQSIHNWVTAADRRRVSVPRF